MAEQLRVFVSHASEDGAFCQAMVDALTGAGADVWYDERNLDSGMLRPGIMRELSARPVFLVILSKAAFASSWVRDECEWAYNLYHRKPERLILPVAGAPYDPDDLDTLLYIESMKRIERTGHQPYPTDEAIRRLLRALALTPAGETPTSTAPQPREDVDDLLMRGKALIAQDKYTEALPLFEHATQLASNTFDAWANLGLVLRNLGRAGEALLAYDQALALDSTFAEVWVNKGAALHHLGRSNEALTAYDQALSLNPNLPQAWNNKGVALGHLGRYQEELDACDRALALDPNNAAAWNNKGNTLNYLGKSEEALAALDRALALDGNNAAAWNNKGYALLKQRRYDEAMASVDHALALNPNKGERWSTKGEILNALGRYQDALLCLDRAISLNSSGIAEIWQDRAVALRGLGRTSEAEAAERRARELGWQG